jgi:hypothetical protein
MSSKLAIMAFGFSVGVILVMTFFPSSKPQSKTNGGVPVVDIEPASSHR